MERSAQLVSQPNCPNVADLPAIGSPRLLIVDDEPLMAEYIASIAEEAGWTVEIAATAAEFEARYEHDEPDMIALDLAMPGRDGVELLRYLSSSRYLGNLIIVSACDAAVVETSAMLALEHGLALTGYLQKPVRADEFAALLSQSVAMIPRQPLIVESGDALPNEMIYKDSREAMRQALRGCGQQPLLAGPQALTRQR